MPTPVTLQYDTNQPIAYITECDTRDRPITVFSGTINRSVVDISEEDGVIVTKITYHIATSNMFDKVNIAETDIFENISDAMVELQQRIISNNQ